MGSSECSIPRQLTYNASTLSSNHRTKEADEPKIQCKTNLYLQAKHDHKTQKNYQTKLDNNQSENSQCYKVI